MPRCAAPVIASTSDAVTPVGSGVSVHVAPEFADEATPDDLTSQIEGPAISSNPVTAIPATGDVIGADWAAEGDPPTGPFDDGATAHPALNRARATAKRSVRLVAISEQQPGGLPGR